MILTITAFKGGVGKTTSAVHLAAYLNQSAPTILIDGDLNRSALLWASKGNLPYPVVDEREGIRAARKYEHVVIDTPARPEVEEIKSLSRGGDLLLLPTSPDVLAMGALKSNVQTLRQLDIQNYKILVTIVPPKPSTAGPEARDFLEGVGLPVLDQMVRRLAVYPKAALEGCIVSEVKGDRYSGIAWNNYRAVGDELCG
ncbi:ParA family protein (plasmid) [Picosynechococcus sp. PCC 11901]|uniref:ParA family protein n=1 Tax=Picosynechococcus sp. PCC 11901 TaxID=2579791 RepID=UPI0010FBBE90|nr:ParA family protein [Picosynechococcus sp. PCC 11901]QCS48024.1 ParA family protein [Picosynechococcus sp. PCC 11901]